jgi:hypothetical protein
MRSGEVKDTVKLLSPGGRTCIGHASADLDLSSGHGGFDIDRADGSVTARTGDGATDPCLDVIALVEHP